MCNSKVIYEVIDGYENSENVADYIVYLYDAKDKGNIDLYAIQMYMKNVHGGKAVRFLQSAQDFARSGINNSDTEFGCCVFFSELALAEIEGLGLADREVICKSDGVSRKIGDILKNYIEYRKTIQANVDIMWKQHMDAMELKAAIENSARPKRVISVAA
jgi:hypothetical protein